MIDDNLDPRPSGESKVFFLQLSAGSGFGLATAEPEVMKDVPIRAGLAPAPLHLYGELGFNLVPSLSLSAFYRNQLVLLTAGVEVEPMFGAKLAWWFDDEGPLLLYSGVGAGYGRIRHTVNLAPSVDFVETTREGPVHTGVGFGLGYAFNDAVALVIDVYIPVLFPDLSVHGDANLGLRFSPF